MYYRDKIASLQEIFATTDLEVGEKELRVGSKRYSIQQDVIDLTVESSDNPRTAFAEDIQFTFGAEWTEHGQILEEHETEFRQYFDIVDLASLQQARVCDLGCGSGRWSSFLRDRCRELVLVDFSQAIYVARQNLQDAPNVLFFKCDILQLPFANDFADFIMCLGVLHHLPIPCLEAVRNLKHLARRQLIFLYYALDNRPFYFRWLLAAVTRVRLALAHFRSPLFRKIFSRFGAAFLYMPLVALGRLLRPFGLSKYVPLYEFYRNKTLTRVEQDVYDRFFTRIEQRVSRAQIMELKREYSDVKVSDGLPYWHFLLTR